MSVKQRENESAAMNRSERIQQRIQEAQQQWGTLSKRIEAVKRDLALAQDGDSRVVLWEKLADLEQQRTEAEQERWETLLQGGQVSFEHLLDKELTYLDDLLIETPVLTWQDRPLMRLSVQGYNTPQEIETLIDALKTFFAR